MNNTISDIRVKVAVKNLTKLSQELPKKHLVDPNRDMTINSWSNENSLNASILD